MAILLEFDSFLFLPLLVLNILIGVPLFALHIKIMDRLQFGQRIRKWGPKIHEHKGGIPTMGGVPLLLILSLNFIYIWFVFPSSRFLFPPLCVSTFGFGGIGLMDDIISVLRDRSMGLTGKQKLVLQFGVSIALYFSVTWFVSSAANTYLPFADFSVSLNNFIWAAVVFVVAFSTVNSANLTDGLDGLLAGCSLIIIVAFGLIVSRDVLPLLIACGSCLAVFLWFNFYPAQLFLGDTGSFALGGFIAGLALVSGFSLLLPIVAGLFVLETLSVIVQVGSYKLWGGRVFKVSPFHHHFEHAEGVDYSYLLPRVEWEEPTITVRLWLVELVFASIGVALVY